MPLENNRTFEQRLEHSRTLADADLARRLAGAVSVPDRLGQAMQHAVLGGGKRFRPFLVLESARLFDAPADAALTVAAALEAVHCYSLAHDDLPAMDNDAVRRGQPTVWKAFDEWTAILAGDALLTVAFEWLAEPGSAVPSASMAALVAGLAAAAGPAGMVGGQVMDLAAGKLGAPAQPDVAHITQLQAMKTGALIRFACRAGPLLAGRQHDDLATLTTFGEALGLAFQISDDLLDASGDAASAGKAIAKDAAAGKATFVSLYGVDGARDVLARTQQQAHAALAVYGARAHVLREAIEFVANRTR